MRKLLAAFVLCIGLGNTAHAYLLTEDLPNLFNNIVKEARDYAQYIQQTFNQGIQIEHEVTQITNQLTQLARLGNPNYYVNMLNIGAFAASTNAMVAGVGNTISTIRGIATGNPAAALSYTAQGLYPNLSGMTDRFGNPVNFNTASFAKFGAIQTMVEAENVAENKYNTGIAGLLAQLNNALKGVSADATQIGAEKYAANVNGVHAQVLTQSTNAILSGQRLQAQDISNRNATALLSEAHNQMMTNERHEDIQILANFFSSLLGGPTNPVTPLPASSLP
jgi:hypothetical protein